MPLLSQLRGSEATKPQQQNTLNTQILISKLILQMKGWNS